ncbi:hypothetical protein MNBD_GAMMA10-223 [hydrothermal vent metagenome]|uniref:DUF1266 domain-containing protein n=1 Tax=hydrothermal vent metagenome TaxID=652676 RepID=A0A3B0YB73_9ZZZZ
MSHNPDNLSTTQLWGLALSSLLTEMNHQRHDILDYHNGEKQGVEQLRHVTKRDWGIETREELLDILDWLKKEGQNANYLNMQNHIKSLSEAGINAYIEAHQKNEDLQNRLLLVKNYRHALNNSGILAWDIGRYVYLCRCGACLELFSQKESWEFIFKASLLAQKTYDSWYSFAISYIAGRKYWRAIATEDRALLEMDIVLRLTGDEKSPWNTLKWNHSLTLNEL